MKPVVEGLLIPTDLVNGEAVNGVAVILGVLLKEIGKVTLLVPELLAAIASLVALPQHFNVPSASFWYPLPLVALSGKRVLVPSLNLMLCVAIWLFGKLS